MLLPESDAVGFEGTEITDNTEINDLSPETSTEETPGDSSPQTQAEDTAEKTETDTTSESSTEEGKADDKPQTPFHEDPAVQDYINRQVEKRAEKIREEVEQSISTKFSPKEETNIPDWFGGNEAAWKAYQADRQRELEETKRQAVAEIEANNQKEQERIKAANDWLEQSVKEIESSGYKVDKNKLLKTAADFQLVDTEGRWNYKAAAEILKAREPKVDLTDKKKLASVTTTESKAEDKPKDYVTPADIRKKGWSDF